MNSLRSWWDLLELYKGRPLNAIPVEKLLTIGTVGKYWGWSSLLRHCCKELVQTRTLEAVFHQRWWNIPETVGECWWTVLRFRPSQSCFMMSISDSRTWVPPNPLVHHSTKNCHVSYPHFFLTKTSCRSPGVSQDIIKCLAPTHLGDFALPGRDLRSRGLNRIGGGAMSDLVVLDHWSVLELVFHPHDLMVFRQSNFLLKSY